MTSLFEECPNCLGMAAVAEKWKTKATNWRALLLELTDAETAYAEGRTNGAVFSELFEKITTALHNE